MQAVFVMKFTGIRMLLAWIENRGTWSKYSSE